MIRVAIYTERLPDDEFVSDIMFKVSFCLKYNIPFAQSIDTIKSREMKVMKIIRYYEHEYAEFQKMKNSMRK